MRPSLEELRFAFEQTGISVSDWAAAHGFRRENVYAVLSGRSKGRRGQSHRIATALGLKPRGASLPWGPDGTPSEFAATAAQRETPKEPSMT